MLVLLVLVLARDQLARTRGRLPVDLAQAVADAVLAHLVEIGALAAAALEVRTDHARGLFCRQPGDARQRREVGGHAHPLRPACDAPLPPQSPPRPRAQPHAPEPAPATPGRPTGVTETPPPVSA